MKKDELLVLTKEALGLNSKKEADGFLSEVDAIIETLANGLEVGDKVKLGNYVVVEKKHVPEKEGTTPSGEKFVKEAHDILKIKFVNKIKEIIK